MKIFTLIGLAFFYAFIIWVNKRAVRKDLKPLLQDIETIQKEVLQNA
jgi:uncharacterized membrane protein